MKRFIPIVAAWMVSMMACEGLSASLPRIVLLSKAEGEPPKEAVAAILEDHLKQVEIELKIDTQAIGEVPASSDEWWRR